MLEYFLPQWIYEPRFGHFFNSTHFSTLILLDFDKHVNLIAETFELSAQHDDAYVK